MKVLVCGDRAWTDEDKMREVFAQFPPGTGVISGGAAGADAMADKLANEFRLAFWLFPAQWKQYGRAAGPIRNQQMLDEHPDKVIAFHSDIVNSKGTKDMIARARKKGTPVKVVV